MTWPKATDYYEAVQDLRATAGDEELQAGEVARNPLGLPILWSGNFADVYRIHCPATGNTWALKCFTRQVRGLHERYRHIAAHLEQVRLPFTVDFQFLDEGLQIGGQWYPVLKMRWVQGLTLTQYVEEHLDRPANLKLLLAPWLKMAALLRQAGVAHADLQHGNVLLVPQEEGALALRLIDYDGMYVPALAGTRSGEVGHPAYQHPQRVRQGVYNAEVDRFPHLVIYTALDCLTLGRRELWARFNNGDNLLFREADFCNPRGSELLRILWGQRNADVLALTGRMILAARGPLDEVPLLEEIVDNGHARPLSGAEKAEVDSLLSRKRPGSADRIAESAWRPQAASQLAQYVDLGGEEDLGGAGPLPAGNAAAVGAAPPPPAASPASPWPAGPAPSASGVFRFLFHVCFVCLTPLRFVDRLLGALAGDGNRGWHIFFRILAAALIVAAVAIPIVWMVAHAADAPPASAVPAQRQIA